MPLCTVKFFFLNISTRTFNVNRSYSIVWRWIRNLFYECDGRFYIFYQYETWVKIWKQSEWHNSILNVKTLKFLLITYSLFFFLNVSFKSSMLHTIHGMASPSLVISNNNTYRDTGQPFKMFISEELWHSHLLPCYWQWSCHYLFYWLRYVPTGDWIPINPIQPVCKFDRVFFFKLCVVLQINIAFLGYKIPRNAFFFTCYWVKKIKINTKSYC